MLPYYKPNELLTYKNAKIVKSMEFGYLTAALHLAPAKSSGFEVCFGRSKGCTKACNNTAGRGRFDLTQDCRVSKTRWLFQDKESFIAQLCSEIEAHIIKADKLGLKPAMRLNATSDIPWWHKKFGAVIQRYPEVMFYDYTKILSNTDPNNTPMQLENYHVTFSRSEVNIDECIQASKNGVNIAVSFELDQNGDLPDEYLGLPVIPGDVHDLTFLHQPGHIIGLSYKIGYDRARGELIKRDYSGFTILHHNGVWYDNQINPIPNGLI